jgi:hypothetical protein
MTRKSILFVLTVFLANFGMTGMAYGRSAAAGKGLSTSSASLAASRVPLYFETNQGQTDGKVRFLARAGGYTAFLTSHETVLLYHNGTPGEKDGRDAVVRMGLSGSLESSVIEGGERLPGIVNYLIGNDPSKWHTRIPTYSEVHSDKVYPGVDLVYRASGKQLEFDFHVAAGANPDPIQMTYSGAFRMHLNAVGDLVLETSAGPASILKPVAYQDVDNKHVPVSASYALLPDGKVGFRLGRYDHSRPLVIDPTVGPNVHYSTYVGSGGDAAGGYDTFKSIAVDAAGEAFICGTTTATNYPTGAASGTPYESTYPSNYISNGTPAGFVTALNADGTAIIYSTYIAGTGTTSSYGGSLAAIAVNSTGNAFVAGQTDDSTFPTTKGFQTTIPGSRYQSGYLVTVGTVSELSQNGDSLVYSTFIGGGDVDSISAIAVDGSSNAYITGVNDVQGDVHTTSGFPIAGSPIWGSFSQQNIGAGFEDAFAAKIAPPTAGNATLVYSTVIGSANSITPFTYGTAIAVDSSGDAYITGTANCDIGDHDTINAGVDQNITTNLDMTHVTRAESEYVSNVWVLELNPAGTRGAYLAYLGGSAPGGTYSPDTGVAAIAVDSSGQAYVAGTTEATNFETTSGAFQTTSKLAGVNDSSTSTEQSDGFVTVIAADGGSFTYSTYLNGSTISAGAASNGFDGSLIMSGIALGTGGQFAVSGISDTSDFPVAGNPAGTPLLSSYPGCPANCADGAAFLTKFTTSGLVYSIFLGAGGETVNGLASNGTDMYVMMAEPANGLATSGAYDSDNSSGLKELVVRVFDASAVAATTTTTAESSLNPSTYGQPVTFTATVSSSAAAPTGTVQFVVDGVSFGTPVALTAANGTSSTATSQATSTLSVAGSPHTVQANFVNTDGNFSDSSGPLSGGQTITLATQATLTVTGVPATAQAYGATFTVGSSGGSGTGLVTFGTTGSCLVSGTTVTITSGSGTCSVTATKAADGNYAIATSAAATVNAALATQATLTVTGVPAMAQPYGATFTVGSSGGSGTGSVTFGATGSCSVSGTTVTITSGSGTCTVTATKAADANYAVATSAAATVNAALATQATLTVTGVPAMAQPYNATFTVGSSGGSGTGLITFGTTGSCSVSASTVTINSGSGICSVTATKAADANYAVATSAAATVNAALATQATLTVTGVPAMAQAYSATFTVGSSGGSGTGLVTFGTTGSCAVSGTTVTITSGSGTCSVTATKATDGNYAAATSAAVTVGATLAAQATLTVTGVPAMAQPYNATFTVGSSGGSGTGLVTFGASGSCSVASSKVTITSGTGTCSVTATKAADGNYAIATSAAATVAASKAAATVALASLTQTYSGSPLAASATTTPTGLNVTFTYGGSATAPTAAGSYAVVGTVNDPNYQGSATGTLTIGLATLTITANNVARLYGAANPAFSGSVTGAVTGDSFTESFSTVATILSPVSTYAIVPAVTGANLSDYTQSIANGTLTITQAPTTTSLSPSSASITLGQSVTLIAQVASTTSGAPTGTVTFYDGGTLLNTGTLNIGTATYTTAALAPGLTHTITATYSGDTNFTTSSTTSSTLVTVAPLDFTLTVAGPASGTVLPGKTITYQVNVAPDYGSYAGTVDFAVSGLPPGATATFSPSSIAANGGPQTITVTIQTAAPTAAQHMPPPPAGRRMVPLALAMLLLFGAGGLRRSGRRLRQMFYVVLLLAGGAASALLSGCGSNSGFFAQPPQSYNITITATSGNLQHTATVALNLE